jgi:hypothetical protein
MFFTRYAGIKAAMVSVLVCSLTPCFAQQHATKPPASAVSIQSLVSALAIDESASYTNNDWSFISKTGLIYKISAQDDSFRCSNATVSSFGRAKVCYNGPRCCIVGLSVSIAGNSDQLVDRGVSDQSPVAEMKKILGMNSQVKLVRGMCSDDSAMLGTAVISVKIPGKKPVFGYIEDSSGGASGEGASRTITFELAINPSWKCSAN